MRRAATRASVTVLVMLLALAMTHAAFAAEHPASTGVRPDGSSAAAPADAPGSPGAPVVDVIAEGLNAPTVLAIGPDGSVYYGEWKTGAVKRADTHETVLDVGEVAWGNERGFVGLAIDAEGYFFTFHTTNATDGGRGNDPTYGDSSPFVNHLIRWTPDGEKDAVLFDDLPASDWHNAGRLWVDPRDDTLWVSYGETNERETSQDPSDLRGSILHMDRDGNPVPGNIAPDSLVYSYGHRQPYGFAVDPESGRAMVAENMNNANDEVNLVEPGANYGWPACEGPCDPPREEFVDPVIYYEGTIGPTTGTFLAGDFYFGDFNFGQLHRVYEHDGQWFDEIAYAADVAPILHVVAGPEGNTIYYTSWNSIVKLTFPDLPADSGGGGKDDPNGNENGTPPGDGNGDDGGGATARNPLPAPALPLLAGVALAAACLVRRRGDAS